ncbi:hypothetical protein BO83DRAFT_104245 [Aspergillus eucalypticola CBS 122712]|uniref:Uncharacterized protein n=1 Tax=Aspergillus eucalypticola (strain CBS 122712 / IBT 29274) TaxID=1448314 RepID=A0A317V1L7_ASPEC|nr:uncharacterized protein BO83DRAFT_104245 [Aspergillus eucalypticola CBS 122712]PWY66978.1 hypothetical protein BO83DRAFT_104245 [Aspergillus eucalypticola CBS 122712]
MFVSLTAQESTPKVQTPGSMAFSLLRPPGFWWIRLLKPTIQARLHPMELTITCHVNWYQLSGPTVSSQQTWENLSNECPGKAKTRRKRKPGTHRRMRLIGLIEWSLTMTPASLGAVSDRVRQASRVPPHLFQTRVAVEQNHIRGDVTDK